MTFAYPYAFSLCVFVPLIIIFAVRAGSRQRLQSAAMTSPRLRHHLVQSGGKTTRWLSLIFLSLALLFLIAALARPQGKSQEITEKSKTRNVLIALDLSRSMRAQDLKPDRLSQAKVALYELMETLPQEHFGVIGFAGRAYSYAPLTVDHGAVRETIEEIDEKWVPMGGSNLAEALDLAIATFKKTGQKNNMLVILSDGEENDGKVLPMIAKAKASGIYIFAIGVGTKEGGSIPAANGVGVTRDRSGRPVLSRLHEDVLRKLAEETNGYYAQTGTSEDIPSILKQGLSRMDEFQSKGQKRSQSVDFYQWALFPSVLFLFLAIISATQWRLPLSMTKLAIIAGTIALFTTPSKADSAHNAKTLFKNKDWQKAEQAYQKLAADAWTSEHRDRYYLGAASSAYQAQKYPEAITAFSHIIENQNDSLLNSAHIGLGNSLFQLGWKQLSGQSYPMDAAKSMNMEKFDALVLKKLEQSLQDTIDKKESKIESLNVFEDLITQWADSAQHFQTVLKSQPQQVEAKSNQQLVILYLNRLAELLKQEQKKLEQAMQQSGQGESKKKKKGKNGEPSDEDGDEKGEDGEKSDSGDEDSENKKNGDKKDDDNKREGETPEEQARRALKEGSDLEKGPLNEGNHELRTPKQDW